MRKWKVGLAAAAGGAAFAITGGLAAPAIAAGMASVLGLAGSAAAPVAGAITGFMSSQVGLVAVTGTVAGAGAATTGSSMAYRTAEVKEFGFMELGAPAESPSKAGEDEDSVQSSVTEGGDGIMVSPPASSLQREEAEAKAGAQSGWKRLFGRGNRRRGAVDSNEGEKETNKVDRSATCSSASSISSMLLLPSPLLPRRGASEGFQLSVVVGISGWAEHREDFSSQWRCLRAPGSDRFALVWETDVLRALSRALSTLATRGAASQGAQLAARHLLAATAGLLAALGPTAIIGGAASALIGNSWAVALERAAKAGRLLAQGLSRGGSGGRPVTLVGHSAGAAVAFHCLLELDRLGVRGAVQDVFLIAAPLPTAPDQWRAARRATAGRLVNGFSRNDWLLGALYSAGGLFGAAAGLEPVVGVAGVENVDLTQVAGGHLEFLAAMGEVMGALGVGGGGWEKNMSKRGEWL
jgi:hypothetical protein